MDLTETEKWRYPRFFTDRITSDAVYLGDDDLFHALNVLRLKRGDKITACDGNGMDYVCEYAREQFRIIEREWNTAEPSVHLRLFQCLPKSDKMDWIIQKAVELGASEIIPVLSARCVSRPDSQSAARKVTRWNKIAYEAAKQCGRGKIPVVGKLTDFSGALREFKPRNMSIIFYECGGEALGDLFSGVVGEVDDIDVIIGSEGGFEAAEVELARERGFIPASLGKRILRVDTASVAALAIIMQLTGNI
jgi:16S rRNA (uracil1498-N3)-methyltransferase